VRIPGKNKRPFCGRPIIEYSIEAALASGCFSRVVVSTDDDETLNIAKAAGVDGYWRSPKYAGAHAIMAEAVIEVLQVYAKHSQAFEYGCFITPQRLREGLGKLKEGWHVVCPVYQGPHVERSLSMADSKITSRFPEHNNVNSDGWLESYYHAGQWFWFDVAELIMEGTLMPEKTAGVVIDKREAVDIDTLDDWRWAERLYGMSHRDGLDERIGDWIVEQSKRNKMTSAEWIDFVNKYQSRDSAME
jgi:N-acylneuraminate cytidylyltransferase